MKGQVTGRRAVRRWFALAEDTLQAHAGPLNRLNVFPVADSDTGSNMIATLRAAGHAVEGSRSEDLGELLAAAGSGAMIAARGNSGTLLGVLISGFAEPLHGQSRLTLPGLSAALDRGGLRAWSALSDPVAGTMLSVVDTVAEHLRAAVGTTGHEPGSRAELEAALAEADVVARRAVVATEEQLETLRAAGVVDSGGAGVMLVVAALKAVITGGSVDHGLIEGLRGWARDTTEPCGRIQAEAASGVEIMCTVRLDPLGAASLRHQLDTVGDSVIITPVDTEPDDGGSYRWRIHVHTEEVSRASSVLQGAGTVEDWQVTEMAGGR